MTHLYFYYTTDVLDIDLVVAGLTAQAGYHWCHWASIIQHRDPVRRSHPHDCLERFTTGCFWWKCRWRRWKCSKWEQILIIPRRISKPRVEGVEEEEEEEEVEEEEAIITTTTLLHTSRPWRKRSCIRWSRAPHSISCSWRRHACPLFLSGGRAKPPSAGCAPVLRRLITNRRDTMDEMCIDEIWV